MGRFADLLGTVLSAFKIGRATLSASALTAQRSFALPDKSGTFAMLDDIGGADVNYQEFTTSGTWVHPEPGVPYHVFFEIVGGGGGGGSGAATVTANSSGEAGGGQGGSPGAIHYGRTIEAGNVAVVVGAGGSGGAAVTSASGTNMGNNGTAGGLSAFGMWSAPGGKGGESWSSLNASHRSHYYNGIAASNPYTVGIFYAPSAFGTNGNDDYNPSFAGGGTAGVGYIAPGPNGGNGVSENNANAVAGAGGSPAATNYGASGAGGGGALVTAASAGRTATSGGGGNGAPGRVRVWAWRA